MSHRRILALSWRRIAYDNDSVSYDVVDDVERIDPEIISKSLSRQCDSQTSVQAPKQPTSQLAVSD